jgi:hypothetical protein
MYKTGVEEVVKNYIFHSDVNCDVRNCQNSCPQTSHVVMESEYNILVGSGPIIILIFCINCKSIVYRVDEKCLVKTWGGMVARSFAFTLRLPTAVYGVVFKSAL